MPPQDLLVKIKDIFTKPGFGNPFYTEPTQRTAPQPKRLLLDDTETAGMEVRERVRQQPILGMLGALGVAGELVGRGVEKLTGSKGAGFAADIATPIGPGFLKAAPLAAGLFGKAIGKAPKIFKELEPLAQEARKYKSAEEFVRAQGVSKWSELQKTNPDLFNTGILRKSQAPYKAVGEIPQDIHTAQGKWQNYGQYAEVPADVVYKRIDSGSFKGEYVDKAGNPVRDKTGRIIQDIYDDATGEWIKPTVSNQQLKDSLLEQFKTPEGKKYLSEVIDALPKNPDGSITAYRIGAIGDGPQSYTLSEGMAKTFSNQGTDILPAGTPGLPTGGYKDFGVLPANTVKIDPKGIVAWSPYDAEILVESKYVKTKSQLTDFYNQAVKRVK